MLLLETKSFGKIEVQNLVLDMNGTIACDGKLIPGIQERIQHLKEFIHIYLVSADTFGTAQLIAEDLGIHVHKLDQTISESEQKAFFLESLNAAYTVAIGNGQNDIKMLKIAKIGIGIIGPEGMAAELLLSAKIIVNSPLDALDLLIKPKRLLATLRD